MEIFAAPSHLAAGESWVFLGSFDEIPQDAAVAPLSGGVEVLETLRLSPRALSARIQVLAGTAGKLLKVSSPSAGSDALPELYLGQAVPALSEDANIPVEDLAAGPLTVGGKDFTYGYFPGADVNLAAVRIHNRKTGAWHRHEIAQAEAEAQAAVDQAVDLGPAFKEVDPLEALPDTDGDGIYDFEEEPEGANEPRPDFLGVALAPGENMLDLVTVDEAGNTSWRTIGVVSTHVPQDGEQ
jgi:hypothetical protein